jgi:hypothetical protein
MEFIAQKMNYRSDKDEIYQRIFEKKLASGDIKGSLETIKKLSSSSDQDAAYFKILEKNDNLEFMESIAQKMNYRSDKDEVYKLILSKKLASGG